MCSSSKNQSSCEAALTYCRGEPRPEKLPWPLQLCSCPECISARVGHWGPGLGSELTAPVYHCDGLNQTLGTVGVQISNPQASRRAQNRQDLGRPCVATRGSRGWELGNQRVRLCPASTESRVLYTLCPRGTAGRSAGSAHYQGKALA